MQYEQREKLQASIKDYSEGLLDVYNAGNAYMKAVRDFRLQYGYLMLEAISEEIEYASDKSVTEAMSTLGYDLREAGILPR